LQIAVIGGGISGLTTAFYLKKYSKKTAVTLYESKNEFGGKLKTVERSGFRVEMGASGFCEGDLEIAALIKDAGLEQAITQIEESKTKYFFDGGKLHKIPNSFSQLLKSKAIGIHAKLRLIACFLFTRPKNIDDKSLEKFCSAKMGRENGSVFCDLLAVSAFGSTPEKLSLRAALDWIGAKTTNPIKNALSKVAATNKKIVFKNGASSFAKELSNAFLCEKKLNTEVVRVKKEAKKWIVETSDGSLERFDKVVFATPSYISARLLKDEDDTISELLKSIEYSPLAIATFGYEKLFHPMDGSGLLTTKRSNSKILGVIWDSSVYAETASEDRKLLRVIIGGQREPLSALKEENELLKIATTALAVTMDIHEEPMLQLVERWHKATPNYAHGHYALVDKIFDRVKTLEGLYFSSSAYRGVSLNDCVKNAKETALEAIARE